ncbi:hypothetical protein [Paenibacillus sp. LHD-38]|uniref:hypothetical protein n=1 Tax=Paenibacillus sp. LHD-38 TaxID=3072143 RepID=UPI0028102C2E|nr:hypothetical protein [Paenibacillus sp. LHD-38]MDQ8735098.1 hypothetical protein [Paenibacillus sp. LHD-38]
MNSQAALILDVLISVDYEAPNEPVRNDCDLHVYHNDRVSLPNGIHQVDAIEEAFPLVVVVVDLLDSNLYEHVQIHLSEHARRVLQLHNVQGYLHAPNVDLDRDCDRDYLAIYVTPL